MRSKPFFSVCIPNYNYEKFIGRTIESVLAQSYDAFEIIVADNASTDGSREVVRGLASPRVRLIENRYNIGFSPNLDRATEEAKGDHLILLSSDDLMRPDALATYAEALEALGDARDHAVLTAAVDVIDPAGTVTEVLHRREGALFYDTATPAEAEALDFSRAPERYSGIDALRESLRAKNAPAAFLATCYSRALYDRVEGYNNACRVFPDFHFLTKLLAEDPIFLYVPRRLFAYRVHTSNQASTEAAQGALKYQVDAYMHTVEFPETALRRTGVSRQELVDVFIEKAVMERGLQSLASGNALKAFRCLAFGLATYPRETLREPKTYGLAALLGLGPLGGWTAKSLLDVYRVLQRKKAVELR